MYVIETKYLGPTPRKGSRIKASTATGQVIVPVDFAKSSAQNHRHAAQELARKLAIPGRWYEGERPDGLGHVYVVKASGGDYEFLTLRDADGSVR